jgi:hypothetical protein
MPEEQDETRASARANQGGAWGTAREVVKRLQEQAYLFVFGLVILVVIALLIPSGNILLTIIAFLVALALGLFAIWSVERKKDQIKDRATDAAKQDVRALEDLQDERSAIQGLLEGIVSNDEDTYFIYSSTIVKKVYDHDKPSKEIVQPFYSPASRPEVTTYLDTRGIAEIYALLHLAGKRDENLYPGTAESFQPTNWNANLILIGSGNSNPKTDEALELGGCPFRFSKDRSVIERRAAGTPGEPSRFEHTKDVDHALLAKLKRKTPKGTRVYLVIAGIGAYGTVAACSFLHENVIDLYDYFEDAPFALILQVDPKNWTVIREVARAEATVAHI